MPAPWYGSNDPARPDNYSDVYWTVWDDDNVFYARRGNDTVMGLGGEDTIWGGDGTDGLADGNDSLVGGDGNDKIYGENGDDRLLGLSGNDSLYGGNGNDLLQQNLGSGFLTGGAGNDRIESGIGGPLASFSTIAGGSGDDRLLDNSLSHTEFRYNWYDDAAPLLGHDTIYGFDVDDVNDDSVVLLNKFGTAGSPEREFDTNEDGVIDVDDTNVVSSGEDGWLEIILSGTSSNPSSSIVFDGIADVAGIPANYLEYQYI